METHSGTLLILAAAVMALTCERWRNPLWTLSLAVFLIAIVLFVERLIGGVR